MLRCCISMHTIPLPFGLVSARVKGDLAAGVRDGKRLRSPLRTCTKTESKLVSVGVRSLVVVSKEARASCASCVVARRAVQWAQQRYWNSIFHRPDCDGTVDEGTIRMVIDSFDRRFVLCFVCDACRSARAATGQSAHTYRCLLPPYTHTPNYTALGVHHTHPLVVASSDASYSNVPSVT